MRNLNMVVVHCSATKEGKDYSVDTIRGWHKARGFRDIGYHIVVGLDGEVRKGRPIEQSGAHAKGYNSYSVGVCYIGGLDSNGKPNDTRTVAQIHSLKAVIGTLKALYGNLDVKGHRDLSVDMNGDGVITPNEWMKSCPCFNITEI